MSIPPFARRRSDKPQLTSQTPSAETPATTTQGKQEQTLPASQDSVERMGCDYGDFRVERMLGAGGMGVVYVARHRVSGQLVALKVLRQSIYQHRALTQRFRREFQAIAMLEHAHIVPLVASGIELENAFLAMLLIDGVTLTEIIALSQTAGIDAASNIPAAEIDPTRTPVTSLSVAECAALLASDGDYFTGVAALAADIADALQAAHNAGIVHRDIKPSNILLDTHGKAWLTDFGLASFSDDQTVLTLTGEIVGTPAYMSPEQTLGRDQPIDERSDIYSLGATLFELATLQRPFKGNRNQVLFRVMRGDMVPPRAIRPEVPACLEAIILKAMALSPNSRYRCASDMAADLRRFTTGKLVHAKRPGRSERIFRWIENNPLVALTSLLGLAATIAAIIIVQAINSHALQTLNQTLESTNQVLSQSNTALSTRERELRQQLYVSDLSNAFSAYNERDLPVVRHLLRRHAAETGTFDLRGMAWHLLDGLSKPPQVIELTRHTSPARELAIFPGGDKIVSVGDDGQAHISNLRPQAVVQTITIGNQLDSVAVSPDGNSILVGMNLPRGSNKVRRYDARTGELLADWGGHVNSIESATISPDGSLFATAGRYNELQVRVADGTIIHRIATGSRNESLAFFNDNHHLAALVRSPQRVDSLKICNVVNGQMTDLPLDFNTKTFACSLPSPHESSFSIAAAGTDRISVVRWPSGEAVLEEQQVVGRIRCVDISPGGEIIAAGCDEGSVYVWNLTERPSQQPPLPQVIHAGDQRITSLKIVVDPPPPTHLPTAEPCGIITAGEDGYVRRWSFPPANPSSIFESAKPASGRLVRSSWVDGPNAEKLYLRFADCSIGIVDSELNFRRISGPATDEPGRLLATPNGESAVVATPTQLARINLQSGHIVHRVDKHDADQTCASMLIVGDELFALFNNHIMVMDAETLRKKRIHPLPDDDASQLVRVPGTDLIRIVMRQSIHELEDGKLSTVATSQSTAENYSGITFSQSGEQVAIRYVNGSVRIESRAGQKPPVLLLGHRKGLLDCVFLDDDRVLATSSHDHTLRFWDLATSRELGTLKLPTSSPAISIHYFSKSRALVTTHSDDPPQVWRLSPRD